MLTREQIIEAVALALREHPPVRAAWVGGSEANARTDAFSDIDLVTLAADEAAEGVFGVVERAMESLSPIELKLRVPQTPWPGLEQAIYRLKDAGEHLLIDFAVIRLSTPTSGRFMEVERHGRPRVLFDHDGVVVPEPIDRSAHAAKIAARVEELRVRFPLFQTLVRRAIERGQPVDAVHFYMGFTLRPLIDMLRIAHCPDQFDFGPRYLKLDLPPEVYAAVERLSLVADLEALRGHLREAESLFSTALERVGRGGRGG